MASSQEIEVWTDGACIGNPGKGGFGAVILQDSRRRELSGGFNITTNNRMELMGPIRALQALGPRCAAVVRSDSLYVVKGIEQGWAKNWRARNWMRTRTEKAINADLWALLLDACEQHEVRFEWVRGHAGNRGNERCDALATAAARGSELEIDSGYAAVLLAERKGSGTLFSL